ncbi:NADH-quinone oxidoreductase subunit L [Pyrofollis japonicus]|uniref:NADH-quinone oxidoreductase subunit 5 family protein n=1 Tax=Pyrofollis japonicus TaxID=3060460 RepID=UPI00295BE053|nr:proton-conducting transporter membrane subunit [Pyrofollis japonicus]BEP18376.1 NADH-quinone oxidoreductase subunit L [Pyrofollis japonicus]
MSPIGLALVGVLALYASIPIALLGKREEHSWLALTASSLIALITTLVIAVSKTRISADMGLFAVVGGEELRYSFIVDEFSATMALLTSVITFLIILFSKDYMRGDKGFRRYYAALALFEASMIGVAFSHNLFTLIFFWVALGFSSFILIGYWYEKPRARRAARLALLITGAGDLGLVVALVYSIIHGAPAGIPAQSLPAIVVALIVFAAATKSAQFPLHIWLLEAMEAPTTVSALLHSATMVAAGAYLLERIHSAIVAEDSFPEALLYLGAFTALYAALLAIRESDSKRVLAYSTISNLGIMFLLAALPSPIPSFAHLFVHAWFKAALFLAIAPAIHYLGTTSLEAMGGLRRRMPLAYVVAVMAALAQIGLPYYGSWLSHTLAVESGAGKAVEYVLLADSLLAGIYIGRWLGLAFLGEERSQLAKLVREEPWEKAVYAAFMVLIPGSVLVYRYTMGLEITGLSNIGVIVSSALGLLGFLFSALIYGSRPASASAKVLEAAVSPLAYLEKAAYYTYINLIALPILGSSYKLSTADEKLIQSHLALSSASPVLSRSDEIREEGIQFMLLLGFSVFALIVIVAFMVPMG